jgi:hypothetical protein
MPCHTTLIPFPSLIITPRTSLTQGLSNRHHPHGPILHRIPPPFSRLDVVFPRSIPSADTLKLRSVSSSMVEAGGATDQQERNRRRRHVSRRGTRTPSRFKCPRAIAGSENHCRETKPRLAVSAEQGGRFGRHPKFHVDQGVDPQTYRYPVPRGATARQGGGRGELAEP